MTTLKACERDPGSLNEGRDRSPGDTAERSCRATTTIARPLNEGRDRSPGDTPSAARQNRSTKAGTVVPATPCGIDSTEFARSRPLNEGRDRSPGDTGLRAAVRTLIAETRSTKAGTVVPATRGRCRCRRSPDAARSTKAGTVVPATHCTGLTVVTAR